MKKKFENRRWIGKIAVLAVYGGLVFPALFTALAFGGRWLRPLDSFSHFLHYYVLAFIIVAIVAGFLKLRKTAAIALVSLLFAVWLLGPARPFALSGQTALQAAPGNGVKIITFNLLYHNDQIDRIADYVTRQDPDILMFQELSPINRPLLDLLPQYPYRQSCSLNQTMATMVLTKTKPSAQGCLPRSQVAWIDLILSGKPVRVASVHLHWPWPLLQWRQIDNIRSEVAGLDSKRPIILGGDFNAAPWSNAVRTMEDITGSRVVPGFRFTILGFKSPLKLPVFLPIDQILLPEEATLRDVTTGPELGSDHRPVVVTLNWTK
uniref:endonuclease/exonuclease/phosphatase family protein n=1 Tax=Pararhizobium sp. IMCC3301 TaxID=3067904 RepID=UPI002741ED63|nr:endonuclease/exonuclease/phosphatase family protein [Pararhizobium sp. IMCC3301]